MIRTSIEKFLNFKESNIIAGHIGQKQKLKVEKKVIGVAP